MNTNKPGNTYDDTKKMLKTIRNLQESSKDKKVLDEQMTYGQEAVADDDAMLQRGAAVADRGSERTGTPATDSDYTVINDVEVVIHSEDPEDMQLNDDEKGKISQLIDDFRAEVVETAEFDKLNVYESNAKLDGKLGDINLQFTLSTGDDTGLYINGQMLKIDENSLLVLEKLVAYQLKFSSTINDLLVRRRTT